MVAPLAAAKVTGRLTPSTSIAYLAAVDDATTSFTGTDHPVFNILRAQKDLGTSSKLERRLARGRLAAGGVVRLRRDALSRLRGGGAIARRLDAPRAVRGHPAAPNLDYVVSATTPTRRGLNADLFVLWGKDENFFEWSSADIVFLNASAIWRPTGQLRGRRPLSAAVVPAAVGRLVRGASGGFRACAWNTR